jgi:hypothetical protein
MFSMRRYFICRFLELPVSLALIGIGSQFPLHFAIPVFATVPAYRHVAAGPASFPRYYSHTDITDTHAPASRAQWATAPRLSGSAVLARLMRTPAKT